MILNNIIQGLLSKMSHVSSCIETIVTKEQEMLLINSIRSHTVEIWLVERAKIVLAWLPGKRND
jgi:hypothetical protein